MITRDTIKKLVPSTIYMVAILFSTSLSSPVLADGKDAIPAENSGSTRIKILNYSESEVYAIRTKYGYQTNIIFDQKEEIKTISVGDRSLWQIIPSGNRLFIRPMTDNISTNMTLITNKRSYEFDLKSVSDNSQNNIYVARFVYPDLIKEAAAFEAATAAHTIFNSPAIESANLPKQPPIVEQKENFLKLPQDAAPKKTEKVSKVSKNNYNYTYTGPDDIAPLQVYDNGNSTFIKYQSISKPAPSVFVVDRQGKESAVPSTVKGNSLIIENVAGEMILRSNSGEIKIYNEAMN